MRRHINLLVRLFSQQFSIFEPIMEIGSFQIPGQEAIADLRPFFPNKKYIGCDMRHGKGVDRIENVEKLSFNNNSVGTILMLDTLEHVFNCHLALTEVFRVLKPGGMVLASSVMDFPIHDHPYDYWRFTPEAFNQLFAKFDQRIVGWQGKKDQPHTVWVLAVKNSPKNHHKEFNPPLQNFPILQSKNAKENFTSEDFSSTGAHLKIKTRPLSCESFKMLARAYQDQAEKLQQQSLLQLLRKIKHQPKNWLLKQLNGKEEFGYRVYTKL